MCANNCFVCWNRAQRIRAVWLRVTKEGRLPSDVSLVSVVQPLTGHIVRGALWMANVTKVSKAVHADKYNEIFVAEAGDVMRAAVGACARAGWMA